MSGFFIPTVQDITERFENFEPSTDEAVEAKRQELNQFTKAELIEMILEKSKTKGNTVQDLAKAILKDEELIAASYQDIAEAIRTLRPEAKTSAASIASYVSKKRTEWALPERVRISKPRVKKTEPETEPETETPEVEDTPEEA